MTDVGQVLVRKSLPLQPLPQNVRTARRTVFDTLMTADRGDLADTAMLVTSEIVTNAVLHARSEIWLTVTVTAVGVLVEVEDHSPQLPAQRSYDAGATTGRGMTLVDRLVSGFGVRQIPDDGKVVWFTLGSSDTGETQAPPTAPLPTAASVSLLQVPVALYCAFQQHGDALLREYLLSQYYRSFGGDDLDDWNLANEAFGELAVGGAAAFAERDSGVASVDMDFGVRPGAVERFLALQRTLDIAAAMAADAMLLAPPSQPEIVALRDWCCEQVAQQMAGEAASPWRGGASADVPAAAPVRWDSAAVAASDLAVVAADDANRIIAVSGRAAELLGWQADELVGERIVTIVPPAQREAHIAGFVRYLVSGERRLIGTPAHVKALRRDGTEIDVTILIEAAATASGRAVFVATLTPLA